MLGKGGAFQGERFVTMRVCPAVGRQRLMDARGLSVVFRCDIYLLWHHLVREW